MFKKEKQKDTLLFLRNSCLRVARSSLVFYEQSGDKKWLEYFEWFSKMSKDTKKQIERL